MKRYFKIIFGIIKADEMQDSDYYMLNMVTIILSCASIAISFVIPLILYIFSGS